MVQQWTTLLITSVLTVYVTEVSSLDYVPHFPCANPAHKLYISAGGYSNQPRSNANSTCPTSRSLITMADTNETCFQTYLSHIASYTTGSQTVWVKGSPISCYPTTTPCPATARVICAGTITIAARTPECEKVSITNGNTETPSGRLYPSSVVYSCNMGYKLKPPTSIRDCRSNGNWTGFAPECIEYACPGATIESGSAVARSNNRHSYRCDDGYRMAPLETLCISGSQVKPVLQCRKILCNASLAFANGYVLGETGIANESVAMACQHGYELVGDGKAVCQESGLWHHNSTCKAMSCWPPITIPNGTVSPETLWSNEMASVECSRGYKLDGPQNVTCIAPNYWSDLPVCKALDCGSFPRIYNGAVELGADETTVGVRVTIFCKDTFVLRGSRTSVCDTDGMWSSTDQRCEVPSKSAGNSAKCSSSNVIFIAVIGGIALLLAVVLAVLIVLRRRYTRSRLHQLNTGKSAAISKSTNRTEPPTSTDTKRTSTSGELPDQGTDGDACSVEDYTNLIDPEEPHTYSNVSHMAISGKQREISPPTFPSTPPDVHTTKTEQASTASAAGDATDQYAVVAMKPRGKPHKEQSDIDVDDPETGLEYDAVQPERDVAAAATYANKSMFGQASADLNETGMYTDDCA